MPALLRAALLLLMLLPPCLAWGQCPGVTTALKPYADEQLTVSVTPLALSAPIYKPAGTVPSMAVLSLEGGDARYRVSGTPTATLGHPLPGTPPQTFAICGLDAISAFRIIRQASDAILTVTYYKPRTP